MNNKTEGMLANLKSGNQGFLNYLKAKIPVFHNSNIFYRDLANGIRGFFENKGFSLKNKETESLTRKYVEHLESEKVLIKTSQQSWKVNYPEFATSKPGDPF